MVHPAESTLRALMARAQESRSGTVRVALSREPRIAPVQAPSLGTQMSEELRRARELLRDSPMRFDGDIWLVRGHDAGRIEVFAASYAWLFCPSIRAHLGPLCIGIDITDRRGRRLVQWANPDRVVSDGARLAVGGFVDVDEHPREAALREAREELGLGADDLVDLTARHAQHTPVGLLIIYGAGLAPGATTHLGDEVERLAWISTAQTVQVLGAEQAALVT